MTSIRRGDLIASVIAVICLTAVCVESVSNITYVSVIFRHGDRTPSNNGFYRYPKDPNLYNDFYPSGFGQLTKEGKNRAFQLGQVLKERYGKYLGNTFTPNSVYGISSDYDRTKMSLQLVLAALFPPQGDQQWRELQKTDRCKSVSWPWQPIATNYVKKVEDNLFLADGCPLFKMEYNRVINSEEGKKQLWKYADLMKNLTEVTGKNITQPLDLYYLYHTLMAESSMGLPLPAWTKAVFPSGPLLNATILAYQLANNNTLLSKLYIGHYLRITTENMAAIRNGSLSDRRQIYLFSGHATNVASILFALGVYEPHVPKYSSAVFTELHYLGGNYYVKFLHYLGIPSKVVELKLPKCDVLCPLDEYLKIVEDLLPTDAQLHCDKTLTSDYSRHRLPVQTEKMSSNFIKAKKFGVWERVTLERNSVWE